MTDDDGTVLEHTCSDGVVLRARWWEPERPADLPIVVLQHGFAVESLITWRATGIVGALLADGRRVLAPDARGHGRSDAPHERTAYGEQQMADDLRGLCEDRGLAPIDLVGYSMGSVVVLLAATAPQVRRLALGGVGASLVREGGVDGAELEPDRVQEALLVDEPGATTPESQGLRQLTEVLGADRLALAAAAAALHRGTLPLSDVRSPTMVFAGRDDPYARDPQVLVDALPDARLLALAGDHLTALGDPTLAPALVAFLR